MNDDPADISVTVSDEQTVKVDTARIAEVARRTAAGEGAVGEISVILIGAERMADLNQRYLGEKGPTDVLAFPVDGLVRERGGPGTLVGELVVCPEYAAGAGNPLDEELDLLVAHGVLHLLGYDHADAESAASMRDKERSLTGRAGASSE